MAYNVTIGSLANHLYNYFHQIIDRIPGTVYGVVGLPMPLAIGLYALTCHILESDYT